ncbi:hypothetical protein EJ08DRAFT_7806 [Tothia fuscella]|uniref:Uncharacterized protein n=1 Tax=Tothia fuscella TaxID=1048955 RepID=A0A9P4U5C3_9PEZI|nr:hypothetical protein EJ08DRAFT_7806 [Tothia fuscella]
MGWLSFWNSDDSNPVKNLDPSLKEFLEKEQPEHQEAQPPPAETSYHSQISTPTSSQQPQSKPLVPKQSLYQDGRYAHLWKDYTPLYEQENAIKSEQEKLRDLVEDQDYRKAELGRVALESCVFEHLAQQDCFTNGSVKDMMTMCSEEGKVFTRCYKMQAKFMKALGYMNAVGDTEREERIQMHADKLYRQMLEQERLTNEARERGEPIPTFQNPLSPENVGSSGELVRPPQKGTVDESVPYSRIPQQFREVFMNEIQGMSPTEAAVEEAAFLADLENQRQTAVKGTKYMVEEAQARQRRFELGKPTIGDRIKRSTGWDKKLDLDDGTAEKHNGGEEG